MWILSVLAFTHKFIIDRCVDVPGLGRRKIDGTNGANKTYLKQKICMIGTEGCNN